MPTPQPPIPVPLVNGNFHEWTSIRFRLNGVGPASGLKFGVTALNYKSPLKPSPVYGTHPRKLGSTIGIEEPEADVELLVEESIRLVQSLGPGYKLLRFTIVVQYAATGLTTASDTLNGCRIIDLEHGHSRSPDALVVKIPLDVLSIENFGTEALPNPLQAAVGLAA